MRVVEVGEEEGEEVGGESWSFPTFFDIMEGGTTGTEERKNKNQGQTLLFMQPGLEQAPGTLQRQATSHAQRSLVITGWEARPCHSHVNIHTSQHFAWKPVINDLNQRKWSFGVCNVNVLKMAQRMHKKL